MRMINDPKYIMMCLKEYGYYAIVACFATFVKCLCINLGWSEDTPMIINPDYYIAEVIGLLILVPVIARYCPAFLMTNVVDRNLGNTDIDDDPVV